MVNFYLNCGLHEKFPHGSTIDQPRCKLSAIGGVGLSDDDDMLSSKKRKLLLNMSDI